MTSLPLANRLPSTFRFGAATAAYQIEGAVNEGGRLPSIWDVFSHTPGTVAGGDTGDIAADHFHRVEGDLDLLAWLGVDAYRFSIAWPRIQPTGVGAVNAAGIDFYERLVDGLLERGIEPVATLYHWDLPWALQRSGGWTSRDTSSRFRDYAALVADALGDRIGTWTTLNEPWCSAYMGHGSGEHAPGLRDSVSALRAAHHLNLAHGLAAQTLREALPETATVSVTLNFHHVRTAVGSTADVAPRMRAIGNGSFTGPMLHGAYPELLLDATASITDWAFVKDGDLKQIHQPIDALGVNYYSSSWVRAVDGLPSARQIAAMGAWPGCEDVEVLPPEPPLTDMGWNIDPEAFEDLLVELSHEVPDLPMIVTENGAAFADVVDDGAIHDDARTAYLEAHIDAVARAVTRGADVRGYFVWSLLDNFEWALGYAKRFGIVRVDYDDLKRTVKDSGAWYRDLVAAVRGRRS